MSQKRFSTLLPVALTPTEWEARASGLADLDRKILSEIIEEKARAKVAKDQIAELEGARNSLAKVVQERTEERFVDCTMEFHWDEGKVRFVRLDTGEVYRVRDITPEEYQERMDLEGGAAPAEPVENVRRFGRRKAAEG